MTTSFIWHLTSFSNFMKKLILLSTPFMNDKQICSKFFSNWKLIKFNRRLQNFVSEKLLLWLHNYTICKIVKKKEREWKNSLAWRIVRRNFVEKIVITKNLLCIKISMCFTDRNLLRALNLGYNAFSRSSVHSSLMSYSHII